MAVPPDRVLRAFGKSGEPQPLTGGRGGAWRVGNRVFKPADGSSAEIAWQAQVLARVRPSGLRLVVPLASLDGQWMVEGWIATPYVEGVHEYGRWGEIIAIGRRLAVALADLPRPSFLDDRRSAWDVADRVAWAEEPLGPLTRYAHLTALAHLRRTIDARPQVIHGDLTGNVLFTNGLPPAVIDFSAYWRPAAYAGAIVVADALVWEGAGDDLVDALAVDSDADQLLVRAVLARAITEVLRAPDSEPNVVAKPFEHALALLRGLVSRGRAG